MKKGKVDVVKTGECKKHFGLTFEELNSVKDKLMDFHDKNQIDTQLFCKTYTFQKSLESLLQFLYIKENKL